jgi:hypothetical protein
VDDAESFINQKFTGAHYSSLFNIPVAPTTNSETILRVNKYKRTVKIVTARCGVQLCECDKRFHLYNARNA